MAETVASMTVTHPDFAQLAARIVVSNLHKKHQKSFSKRCWICSLCQLRTGKKSPLLADDVYEVIMA